jgi:GNAT superfamily N-acetyltransferase
VKRLRDVAVACRHAQHDLICDRIEPWEHGTHLRATRYPTYYDFNCLRLEHGQPLAGDLIKMAEDLQADLDHRKIEIEDEALGELLRPAFHAMGWRSARLVWMVLEGDPDAPAGEYEEVAFRDIRQLRAEWANDFTPDEIASFQPVEEEVSERLRCRTFVAHVDGRPAAFVLFSEAAREIRLVYTSPAARGRGLARVLVGAAAREIGEHTVIAADDEDTPKRLYERIGFRPAWTMWEMTRRPGDVGVGAAGDPERIT